MIPAVVVEISFFNVLFWLMLVLSIGLNFVLVWYATKMIKQQTSFVKTLNEKTTEIVSFTAHLKALYSLEMFYGDETLQALLEHAKGLSNSLESFENDVMNSLSIDYDEEEYLFNQEEESEEDEIGPEKQELFYGGTRKSNN